MLNGWKRYTACAAVALSVAAFVAEMPQQSSEVAASEDEFAGMTELQREVSSNKWYGRPGITPVQRKIY